MATPIHSTEETKLDLRMLLVPGVLGATLVIFCIRLWYLQVAISEDLKELFVKAGKSEVERMAPRGEIFDRAGKKVAGVVATYSVTGVLDTVYKKRPEVLAEAAEILDVDPEELLKKLVKANNPYLPAEMFQDATVEQATSLSETFRAEDGIAVQSSVVRTITAPFPYCHILGYIGKPSEKILEKLKEQNIKASAMVGKSGIEAKYEADLMGKAGKTMMSVNARGVPIRQLGNEPAHPGSRLYLTIDTELQSTAMNLMKGYKGAVVAIDPKTGEVLCLVSSPSYDLSLFEGGIADEDFQRLNGDIQNKPLFNRAIQGGYSPGSTFKIVTSMAAAQAGTLDYNHFQHCPGYYKFSKSQRIRCDNHGAGMSFHFNEALMKSCNTYFVDLAIKTGPEKVRDMALSLGFGGRLGLDLDGELKGNIPNAESVPERGGARKWFPGDTGNMGIGQGGVNVTPLQMANLMCVVANRGFAFRPHLVKGIKRYGVGKQVEPVKTEEFVSVSLPDSYWDHLQAAMVSVLTSGTARGAQARTPGLRWAGKTGSAEHGAGKVTHSWFVGAAPTTDPSICIAVLAEEAGHGGDVAAPIAASIVQQWMNLQKKRAKPVQAPKDSDAERNLAANSSHLTASLDRPLAR